MLSSTFTRRLKNAFDNKVRQEARAWEGVVHNGQVFINSRSYPFEPAVDCNTAEGKKVWCALSESGKAVILGNN